MDLLRNYLNNTTVDNLKILLKTLRDNKKIPQMRKLELINEIEKLYTIDHLKENWKKLSRIDKKGIAEYIYNYADNIDFDFESFFAKYKNNPDFMVKSNWGIRSSSDMPLSATYFFGNNYEIPLDLIRKFKTFVEKPKEAKAKTATELPEIEGITVKETERIAFYELKAVLRLINDSKLKVSPKTNIPSIASVKAVDTILVEGDFYPEHEVWGENRANAEDLGFIRGFGWLMMLQAGGLAKISGTTLVLTNNGKRALEKDDPAEIIKKLWERWLKTKIIDEFRRIDEIKGQTGKGKKCFTKVEERRTLVNAALTQLDENKWIKFSDFSRLIKSNRKYKFTVTKYDPWDLYLCEPGYGSLGYSGYNEWNVIEDRYMLCLLFEYAATLGLIDIAYISPIEAKVDWGSLWGAEGMYFLSRYDGLLYFSVNSLGSYCLGNIEKYTVKQDSTTININIDGTGLITTNTALPPHEIITVLDTYTTKKSNSDWQITKATLLKALENGHSIFNFKKFAEEKNITIPLKFSKLINDLEKKSDAVKLKDRVVVYELKSKLLKEEFLTDSYLSKICMNIGETLIGVSENNNKIFLSEIKKQCYIIYES
jgi:hypothetical protein